MKYTKEIALKPEEAFDHEYFPSTALRKMGLKHIPLEKVYLRPLRRSIDARSQQVKVKVLVEAYIDESPPDRISHGLNYPQVQDAKRVIIVGAGPAGLFAALRLIELGIKPIVLERGKDVRSRRRDLAAINKAHSVDGDSNYCFGEGGAGTYSDGKLYTRSKKRGDLRRILEILVAHGAQEDILVDAHPHIGTNKLPKIVSALRERIIDAGGEVHFGVKVDDFLIDKGELKGVGTTNGDRFFGEGVILATGHSARDIFELLERRKIDIKAKPFALGVRVEHPQSRIDTIQYHCEGPRDIYLPASSYSLVHQAVHNGVKRGVFSFCMCPGGFIVPSATQPGEVVVNGMSPSRRDSKYANSGIVVAVGLDDLKGYEQHGPLAAMRFQAAIERKACAIAGESQQAPAQNLIDFVEGKVSRGLLPTSYQPGLASVDMGEVLPLFIKDSLRQGFRSFGKKMKGYLTDEAQVIGVESRTSSPVQVPRNKDTYEHTHLKRLYPCGEGAGYAGGIVSASMDGERCAEAIAKHYFHIEL